MVTDTMRIGELAEAAGISPRTIRYYVVEGLLPPPEGAGLGATYSPAHLDRLRLILHLKGTYLPLKEIRRQLTGLSDAEIRRRVAEFDQAPAQAPASGSADAAHESTQDYLRRLNPQPPAAVRELRESAPGFVAAPAPNQSRATGSTPQSARHEPQPDPDAPSYPGYVAPSSPLTVGVATPLSPPPAPPGEAEQAEPWVRLKLGDDVELLVRSAAYDRLRDRVNWLVGWARSIFR